MTPETEQNINQAIDWLQKTGGQIQDFAVEQAPLYCKEVIAWELWINSIQAAFGLVMLGIGIAATVKFAKLMRKYNGDCNAWTMGSMVLALIGLIVGPCNLTSGLPRAIKAAVAPRLVIVEHLRSLR